MLEVRYGERRDGYLLLPAQVQRLTTGCQDTQVWAPVEHLSHVHRRVQQVLEIVDNDQEVTSGNHAFERVEQWCVLKVN